jgi:hypothetical protein
VTSIRDFHGSETPLLSTNPKKKGRKKRKREEWRKEKKKPLHQ